MSTVQRTWRSPLTLLEAWRDRFDGARLQEVLITGYTMDLGFLERFAISTARVLGARITVLADPGQGLHDPVDVRRAGVAYQHGHAVCAGAFHPKLLLLLGEDQAWLAIGSGNPTTSGWGHNRELWLTLRSDLRTGPQLLADVARWLGDLPQVVAMASWIADTVGGIAHRLGEAEADGSLLNVRALGNLHQPLISQLPHGPVNHLRLTAPFVDPTGGAVHTLIKQLSPRTLRIGLQPFLGSYHGAALVEATKTVADREFVMLDLARTYHGKLIEWTSDDGQITTVTGSANITSSALLRSVTNDGNCELAVLAPSDQSLMPDGAPLSVSTVATHPPRRLTSSQPASTVAMLGCAIRNGVLTVELARLAPAPVTIETSPSGVPGTWLAVAKIEKGKREASFPLPEVAGGAIRAVTFLQGRRVESTPLFLTDPSRCRPRADVSAQPRLTNPPEAGELFTDPQVASRFTTDLARLAAETKGASKAPVAASGPSAVEVTANSDRWNDYLDSCQRALGPSLTRMVFPGRLQTPARREVEWVIDDTDPGEITEDEDESVLDDAGADANRGVEVTAPIITAERRKPYRRFASQWVKVVTTECKPDPAEPPGTALLPPLSLRMLVTRLYLTLLAAGVWGDNHSWRTDLRWLIWSLIPYDRESDQEPEHAIDHLCALLAVAVTVLRQDTQITGGNENDLLTRAAWDDAHPLVAQADAALAEALLLPSTQAYARVATPNALAETIHLAADAAANPHAEAVADLEAAGYNITRTGGLWILTGDVSNPIPVAARAATVLGADTGAAVLVRASRRAALVLWRRPSLALCEAAALRWRLYTLPRVSDPAARVAGHPGLPPGASQILQAQPPPAPVQQLADELGLDLAKAMRLLTDSAG